MYVSFESFRCTVLNAYPSGSPYSHLRVLQQKRIHSMDAYMRYWRRRRLSALRGHYSNAPYVILLVFREPHMLTHAHSPALHDPSICK